MARRAIPRCAGRGARREPGLHGRQRGRRGGGDRRRLRVREQRHEVRADDGVAAGGRPRRRRGLRGRPRDELGRHQHRLRARHLQLRGPRLPGAVRPGVRAGHGAGRVLLPQRWRVRGHPAGVRGRGRIRPRALCLLRRHRSRLAAADGRPRHPDGARRGGLSPPRRHGRHAAARPQALHAGAQRPVDRPPQLRRPHAAARAAGHPRARRPARGAGPRLAAHAAARSAAALARAGAFASRRCRRLCSSGAGSRESGVGSRTGARVLAQRADARVRRDWRDAAGPASPAGVARRAAAEAVRARRRSAAVPRPSLRGTRRAPILSRGTEGPRGRARPARAAGHPAARAAGDARGAAREHVGAGHPRARDGPSAQPDRASDGVRAVAARGPRRPGGPGALQSGGTDGPEGAGRDGRRRHRPGLRADVVSVPHRARLPDRRGPVLPVHDRAPRAAPRGRRSRVGLARSGGRLDPRGPERAVADRRLLHLRERAAARLLDRRAAHRRPRQPAHPVA